MRELLDHLKSKLVKAANPLRDARRWRASGFFSSQFTQQEQDTRPVVCWKHRNIDIQAVPFDRLRGQALFAELWATDSLTAGLSANCMIRLTRFLDFVQVQANKQVICQDEQGDYMLLVLDGLVAIDREQPWGSVIRLAEAGAGELLGEMSFLDAGTRFSTCKTLLPTTLAVLDARRLDELIHDAPQLAANFLASMARRLSSRMRHLGNAVAGQKSRDRLNLVG